jgi:hypothetical protein
VLELEGIGTQIGAGAEGLVASAGEHDGTDVSSDLARCRAS